MDSERMISEYMLHQWAGIIRTRRESGLTIKAFCGQSDISVSVYYYWHRKLKDMVFEHLSVHVSQDIATQVRQNHADFVPQGFCRS